jgi:hypothetical protein
MGTVCYVVELQNISYYCQQYNRILCLFSDECTLLFTINCEIQSYMFRTLSWFILRDFSILNYTYFTSMVKLVNIVKIK